MQCNAIVEILNFKITGSYERKEEKRTIEQFIKYLKYKNGCYVKLNWNEMHKWMIAFDTWKCASINYFCPNKSIYTLVKFYLKWISRANSRYKRSTKIWWTCWYVCICSDNKPDRSIIFSTLVQYRFFWIVVNIYVIWYI